MGVKRLNNLLTRMCGMSHVSLVPICNFTDKAIAVDATLYVCILKMKNNYVSAIIEFLTLFRQHRIRPIFVFDGEAPAEKHRERIERADRRAVARNRIKLLERDLEIYKTTQQASDLLKSIDLKSRKLVPSKISVTKIQEHIDRLKSQILSIGPQDFETMKNLLNVFGIPFITAEGEGEFLCSALARHGMVDAVLTRDTDALACLSPNVITDIDGEYFHVVSLQEVFTGLELGPSEFVDLCIMCGTDFNTNIPKIGPYRAYELIKEYRSIDNLPLNIDRSCLNHKRVREIFRFSDSVPSITIPKCENVKYDELSRYTTNVELIKNRLTRKVIRTTAST